MLFSTDGDFLGLVLFAGRNTAIILRGGPELAIDAQDTFVAFLGDTLLVLVCPD